ncbi:hypothetical protein CcrColossus_gp305 [Caulobacter phage CcrColossus]|uniref:Uncharacterized protein n=1 Tax=Caulobacter phage CcrColossus TaxID=1211640 RepID=K4JUZ1_9CAUD|nr:hypothetical protein CcrColossus_gp305 [Caulobacter phage CcrColossus]AFU88175.1 hypothetical protein CcrColossus_gp305 [Caulobacter phage CcrColossus]
MIRFKHADFTDCELVSFGEGRGRLQGLAGFANCRTTAGVEFQAMIRAPEKLRKRLLGPDGALVKRVQVQHMGLNIWGKPRLGMVIKFMDADGVDLEFES